MSWVFEAMLAGITAFAASNIDDILVLTLYFSRVDETLRRRNIIAGQYLGFLLLIAASLPGVIGGLLIPKLWLGWLGLLPIAIGLYHLFYSQDDIDLQTTTLTQPDSKPEKSWRLYLTTVLSPPTYQVAAVTIANGGDNIAIYVPLFANSSIPQVMIILAMFLLMVGAWCAIAHYLSSHPLLFRTLTRYGHRLMPFVLIGLGIFIFVDSETYRLFMR